MKSFKPITLPDGSTINAKVFIFFEKHKEPTGKNSGTYVLRGTVAIIQFENGKASVGVSMVRPGDTFAHKEGRRRAVESALRAYASGVTTDVPPDFEEHAEEILYREAGNALRTMTLNVLNNGKYAKNVRRALIGFYGSKPLGLTAFTGKLIDTVEFETRKFKTKGEKVNA